MQDRIERAEFPFAGADAEFDREAYFEQQDIRLREAAQHCVIRSARMQLGEKLRDCTFDNFETSYNPAKGYDNRRAIEVCREFAEGQRDKGVLLVGKNGIGKNHLAAAVVNRLAQRGISAYVTRARQLQTRLYDAGREGSAEVAINNMLDYRYIVINDLGKESATETSRSYICDFIDQAYESRRKLIVTTNMTDAQIGDATVVNGNRKGYGLHVLSRLHEMCEIVKYEDYDHRLGGKS